MIFSILAFAGQLGAESPRDTGRCRTVLSAPVADSQAMRVAILVSPHDTTNRISTAYQSLIATGIRDFLVLPQPLVLATYDRRPDAPGAKDTTYAGLTLRSAYRAMLHRDGHLTRVRIVGGTRDAAFDEAFVHAVQELGSSGLLPAADTSRVTFRGDSLDIRIVVTPDEIGPVSRVADRMPQETAFPLMLLRMPLRRITGGVRLKVSNTRPAYPEDLRILGVEGKTVLEFVIDATGAPDLASIQVMTATAPQFATAVLDVFPKLRFEPLIVDGCAVPVIVQMPFQFHFR